MSLTQVIIIGSMRSGTTVFRRLLHSCGETAGFGEVFHPSLGGGHNFFRWLGEHGPAHPYDYRDRWKEFLHSYSGEKRIALIDIKIEALKFARDMRIDREWPIFPTLSDNIQTKIIRIKRKNLLNQIISIDVLHKTGVAAVRQGQVHSDQTISIDANTLLHRISALEQKNDHVDLLIGTPSMSVLYEDMFVNGAFAPNVLKGAASTLGVDIKKFQPRPRMQKMGSKTTVSNWDEIRTALIETPYRWMLPAY